MILGAEIGLLLYGIYVLITGKYAMGKGRQIYGTKARILGFLCILPLPLAFIAGFVIGFVFALVSGDVPSGIIATIIEIGILLITIIAVSILSKRFYTQQQAEGGEVA